MKLKSIEIGKGEPLLFLGGALTTYHYYEDFLVLLSKAYKVHMFNYPGFSGSEKFGQSHTLEKYLNVVDQYIDEKGLNNFHLVGSSFGGYLSTKYLNTRKPKKVKSLILLSPGTNIITKSLPSNMVRAYRNQRQKSTAKHAPLTKSTYRLEHLRNPVEKVRHSRFVLDNTKLTAADFNFSLPTLVVVGDTDYLVDTDYTLSLLKNKKNVKVVKIKDAGHDAFATIGDRILEIFKEFTNDIKDQAN